MDIKKGLNSLNEHSDRAKYILTGTIEILDRLDELDSETPLNAELTYKIDNAMVCLYNRLQSFHDLRHEFIDDIPTDLEYALTSKLLENDTDSDEIISRSLKVYCSIFEKGYYPKTWEESDFREKTHSLQYSLKDRISSRIMREDELPEFKERMVGSGMNEDSISIEPITQDIANRRANDFVYWLDVYLKSVCRSQKKVADILDEAHFMLNPQIAPTEINQTESTRDHNKLLDDKEIKSLFEEIIGMGLMAYRDGFYWWETDNVLLSYLCSQISQYKELSKQMRGDDYLPNWKSFNGIFKVKGEQGNWIDCDNIKLGEYKKQYKKNHGGDFNPDGCKQIDEVILKHLI